MKRLFLKLTLSLAILLVASQFYAQEAMGARIDSLCREVFTEWNLPGMSVIVIKDGKEVLHKGYGKTAYDQTGRYHSRNSICNCLYFKSDDSSSAGNYYG